MLNSFPIAMVCEFSAPMMPIRILPALLTGPERSPTGNAAEEARNAADSSVPPDLFINILLDSIIDLIISFIYCHAFDAAIYKYTLVLNRSYRFISHPFS
jgi:hypothetical protein